MIQIKVPLDGWTQADGYFDLADSFVSSPKISFRTGALLEPVKVKINILSNSVKTSV